MQFDKVAYVPKPTPRERRGPDADKGDGPLVVRQVQQGEHGTDGGKEGGERP